MSSSKIPNKGKWEQAHELLKKALKKEINLMRELLANLHQEELSLFERDRKNWQVITDLRSDLIVKLSDIRKKRMGASTEIQQMAPIKKAGESFPFHEEDSCEILTLLDQLFALIERINLQNCRNEVLFDQSKHLEELPLYCNYPHPLQQQQQKQTRPKTAIATYPPKE